jgi:hypothetical protein
MGLYDKDSLRQVNQKTKRKTSARRKDAIRETMYLVGNLNERGLAVNATCTFGIYFLINKQVNKHINKHNA